MIFIDVIKLSGTVGIFILICMILWGVLLVGSIVLWRRVYKIFTSQGGIEKTKAAAAGLHDPSPKTRSSFFLFFFFFIFSLSLSYYLVPLSFSSFRSVLQVIRPLPRHLLVFFSFSSFFLLFFFLSLPNYLVSLFLFFPFSCCNVVWLSHRSRSRETTILSRWNCCLNTCGRTFLLVLVILVAFVDIVLGHVLVCSVFRNIPEFPSKFPVRELRTADL